LHLLFIGDIVGSGGRKLLKSRLPDLRKRYQIDFCVANAENTAAGLGLTGSLAKEIVACGADILTLGNHSWARQELLDSIESIPFLIRPANGPAAWPGKGHILVHHPLGKILVINMLGRVTPTGGSEMTFLMRLLKGGVNPANAAAVMVFNRMKSSPLFLWCGRKAAGSHLRRQAYR